MLALLFVLIWVVIGITIVVIAMRGGPRRARAGLLDAQSRTSRRTAFAVFAVFYVALGIAVPAVVLAADHSDRNVGDSSVKLNAAEEHGRMIFGERCNNCHTLAAARTQGKVGPNLDQLDIPIDAVVNQITNGGGVMPAFGGQLSDDEIQAIAQYVVDNRDPNAQDTGGGGGP